MVAINGNFDDAQTGVKKLFGDKSLEALLDSRGFQFSSANSINIGRLVPQIVYYVDVYKRQTLECGDIIATGTPSGVGMGYDPPRYMKKGDQVTCEIEKIGKRTNRSG